MKLKDKNTHTGFLDVNFKKFFTLKNLIFLLSIVAVISGFVASNKLKTKGYSGLWDFISTITQNYRSGLSATPEKISIEIKDQDFKKLEKSRANAIERGVIINDIDGEYVPATLEYNGQKIKIKLRLKGHMTDHLQNNKWSFRIKVKEKNETIMGMKRFSIQHPGTRGYLYEWIYHEMMKSEDVIALRYKYISVEVNGMDWGIYALEENFENELISNNNRPKGPILRFNPDLYWVNRYNMHTHSASSDEFASYYSANPEAYREENVLKDSVQRKYYMKAIALIEGLRDKKFSVEQVFDIKRMAKFHAVIDMVGGSHSIDWSDIKYYYDPVKGKLEPVAYESFTNLNSHDLTGQYKFVRIDSVTNFKDWHLMIFSNEAFFAEYMKQLDRMSKPEYLDEFFRTVNDEMKKNLAILNREYPYKKFDIADYYKRQRIIKKIISPPKAIHAYLNHYDKEALYIQFAPIDALPVEVIGITINGRLLASKKITLPAKQKNTPLDYNEYRFELVNGVELKGKMTDSLSVQYSLLGSSVKKEAHIFPFPHTDNEFISSEMKNREGNLGSFNFLFVDEERSSIFFKSGKCIIDKDLIIPAGYKVFADQDVILDLRSKAKIVSYSPFFFSGTEDGTLMITSTDSTSEGLEFINALGSVFKYVSFKNFPRVNDQAWARSGALTFYESSVNFSHCGFFNFKSKDAVSIIRTDFEFSDCLFSNIKNDALDIDFSDGKISRCAFEECGTGIEAGMSKLKLNSVSLDRIHEIAININSGAQLTGNDLRIKNCFIALAVEDLSVITLEKIAVSDTRIGIAASGKKAESGHPEINIKGLEMINVAKKYVREKKAVIFINGVNSGEIVDNMKIFIANEKKTGK